MLRGRRAELAPPSCADRALNNLRLSLWLCLVVGPLLAGFGLIVARDAWLELWKGKVPRG
jgi:hypothetical protein